MATKDPRVDAYIAKAAPFARPILTALRNGMHMACPDVVETIKSDETRDRRLAQAVEWMAEGKSRNWKYER